MKKKNILIETFKKEIIGIFLNVLVTVLVVTGIVVVVDLSLSRQIVVYWWAIFFPIILIIFLTNVLIITQKGKVEDWYEHGAYSAATELFKISDRFEKTAKHPDLKNGRTFKEFKNKKYFFPFFW